MRSLARLRPVRLASLRRPGAPHKGALVPWWGLDWLRAYCSEQGDGGGTHVDRIPDIPKNGVRLSFSRSPGSGGQNVNKVNTKAELRFHVSSAEWLPCVLRERLAEVANNRINTAGELVLASSQHRTQRDNIRECYNRLQEILKEANHKPAPRKATVAPSWVKEKRLRAKKMRSAIKSNRRAPQRDDW